MSLTISKKFYLLLICVVLIGLVTIYPKKTSSQSSFDSGKDGLVTNFIQYRQYGGKGVGYTEKLIYEVFLPTGFGFLPDKDSLQMEFTGASSGSDENLGAGFNNCKKVSGGFSCYLEWDFIKTKPLPGEYQVLFKVLDGNTQIKGRIFVDYNKGTTNNSPWYMLNGGRVFISTPLTTPYVEFDGLITGSTFVNRELAPDSIDLTIKSLTKDNIEKIDLFINGNLETTLTNKTTINMDSSWLDSSTDVYTYRWPNIKNLPKGSYTISAIAYYAGSKQSQVVTMKGSDTIVYSIAFDSSQIAVCKSQQKAVSVIMTTLVKYRTNEVENIELIDRKVRNFFVNNSFDLPNYNDKVKNLDAKKLISYRSLTNLVDSSNLSCDQPASGQIDQFIRSQTEAYEALMDYRDGIVDLIEAIKGAANGAN